MKHENFIELVNLYIDGECTLEQARSLENELRRDPARHRIYRQYCQMQKATSMLADQFLSRSTVLPDPLPARPGHEDLIPFRRIAYSLGGLAAAILMVFAFLQWPILPAGSIAGEATASIATSDDVVVFTSVAAPSASFAASSQFGEFVARRDGTVVPAHWAPDARLTGAPIRSQSIQWNSRARPVYSSDLSDVYPSALPGTNPGGSFPRATTIQSTGNPFTPQAQPISFEFMR